MPEHIIKFFGNVFIISALIPFLGNPQFDSQPYPAIAAFFFLYLCILNQKKIYIRGNSVWYAILVLFGCIACIALDAEITLLTARAIFGYIAIFLYYCAFDNYLQRYGFPARLFFIFIVIWLLVGVTQIFYPDLTTALIALRTTSERGVTSLAPEPTHFAIFLFFNCWLILMSNDYKINANNILLCFISLCGCLLLAKSSMIIIFFMFSILVLMFYLFIKDKLSLLFIFLTMILVIVLLSLLPLEGDRLSSFIMSIREGGGLRFFLEDASANQRVSAIIIPAIGLFNNYFLPGGFNRYIIDGAEVAEKLWPIFPYDISDKIMSWNLAMWYELGIFGLLAWLNLFNLNKLNLRGVLEIILLILLLFSAVPHLFPMPIMAVALIRFNNARR